IRWKVFLPPWFLLTLILVLNLADYDSFVTVIDFCTAWIMEHFTGGFCLLTFLCVILIAVTYFSPMGHIRIGGKDSTPMCIYGLPAILFAFVFYNMRQPFSIGSMLIPLLGESKAQKLMPVIDGICLFALCAGMSASLGQGVLLLAGGIENYSEGLIKSGILVWFISTAAIVIIFVIAAITGITKGIQKLSSLNSVLYIILGIAVLFFGPTVFLFNFGVENIGNYLQDFFRISLYTGASQNPEWVRNWPSFYWCNWLAWMPITAVFLAVLLISFVTAADSNTTAMSSLCTEGLTPEDSDSPAVLKILWGFTIGAICFIMLASYGVDGIKKLSNLGGFPDAILMIGFMLSWIRILKNPENYKEIKNKNKFKPTGGLKNDKTARNDP
ncbi:MAG TPA: BCCT family transporter, partial [Candidatus Blautia stercoravium]|nr:BCCT family transporter [Candidatus Blautia stercoravium]